MPTAVILLRDIARLPGIEFATYDDATVTTSYGVVTAGTFSPSESSSLHEGFKIVKGAVDFVSAFAYEVSQHRNFERELSGLSTKVAY